MQTHLKSYAVSPAIWNHTATSHKQTYLTLTQAKQVGSQLI